ncbi:MAG: hypothetical protein ACYDA8_08305 [Deferrisomatales bacterium]
MTPEPSLPEAVARCIGPSAPVALRVSVARGALPLPPLERLVSLAALLADAADEVRGAAREAWEGLPHAFLAGALEDRELPEAVLDLVVATRPDDLELAWRALEHPSLGRRTLERFLDSGDEEALARLCQNQRALDRHPDLARALLANPRLHPADQGRLASLYDAPLEADAELPPDLPAELLEDREPAPADQGPKNLYQLVQSLTMAQKIKLAMLGSKGARRLLIRDPNKTVSAAVIRSPKLREDEVLAFVQDRTIADEVLRVVLERRDWMKSYPIRLALSQNPKTPIPRALRLLETLQDRDLRQVAKSRNVTSQVSAGATRVLARRGKL